MNPPVITLEEIADPVAISKARARNERGRLNDEWLQSHWSELLPQARGKFVAVAGQEAHIANSAEDAWNWARTAHPEDDSATVRYVRVDLGPRIYAYPA